MGRSEGERWLSMIEVDLTTIIAGVRFKNPIFTASGCAASGRELSQFFPLSELGAVVTKSIMLKARLGRATPRMAETPSGMLNSIGLQGPGIEQFLEEDLAWLQTQSCDVIVSIAGETVDEYGALARRLRGQAGISAVEVNISCPNVANRGQVFACNPVTARAAIEAVRINLGGDFPIIAKLTPDVTDITEIAKEVIDAGANGLALINTLLGMVINLRTLKPHLAGRTGGLSGPAIRPIAVRAIYQVRERFPDVAILGMGGVSSGEDALELVAAGANAVSIGTASFGDPLSAIKVRDQLASLLSGHGMERFEDAVGVAHDR
jgi:dihydroorotate dehydrogenase (NAD+) catalytic subunit